MADHFAVLSITYLVTPDGLLVTIVTNVPAHLWLRWTLLEPWIHVLPRLRRGIWLQDDVRFCFDVYTDLEQNEAGDTLTHTFLIPKWEDNTELSHYIWGEIEETVSPSTSAIFKTTSPHTWPPPWLLVRYAWKRQFSRTGSNWPMYVNYGVAATFEHGTDFTRSHQAYLFTKNNPVLDIRVAIYLAGGDDKPTGSELVGQTLNLADGVIDGGDGGIYPVYRHTAALTWLMLPYQRYCLVTLSTGAVAIVWSKFRSMGWLGPKDEGTANIIAGFRTLDNGLTWQAAIYGKYNLELYGYQAP